MSWRLLSDWLSDCQTVKVVDEASVSQVRQSVRQQAALLNLRRERTEKLVVAASELAHNQLRHARDGVIGLRNVFRCGVAGLEVVAADRGPGLVDPTAALSGSGQRSSGLGLGLASAYRLADEMDFDVRVGDGSCFWARKFVRPLPRQEVAVLARPCQGETICGDHAAFRRNDRGVELAVADGLGHGLLGREAANLAIALFRNSPGQALGQLVTDCDAALAQSRGSALAVVKLEFDRGVLLHAAVGDVLVRIYSQGQLITCAGAPGVVGKHPPKVASQTLPFSAGQVLLVHTDGFSSRLHISPSDLSLPPLLLAHQLLLRYGRAHDDALIVVVR